MCMMLRVPDNVLRLLALLREEIKYGRHGFGVEGEGGEADNGKDGGQQVCIFVWSFAMVD
jgi:hypothetical protein